MEHLGIAVKVVEVKQLALFHAKLFRYAVVGVARIDGDIVESPLLTDFVHNLKLVDYSHVDGVLHCLVASELAALGYNRLTGVILV